MILAAGLGTRLRPLTLKTPKPLIKLHGKPLIAHALEYMAQAGVKKIAINTHYLADQIPKAIGDNYKGIPITYLYEPEILGTGGALKNACEQVLGFDEPVLLMNSDIALDLDLRAFLEAHNQEKPAATLLVKTVDRGEDFVEIGSDSESYVQGMVGLIPYTGPKLLERQFCGVHLISPTALEQFPIAKSFSVINSFYVPLIKSGAKIFAVEQFGYYSDLGTLENLEEAEKMMKKFGIFGFPITHSLSPSIHNRAFQKAGLDWIYDLWPSKPEALEKAISNFRSTRCGGANVTIPHKESVMAYLDAITPMAREIGAVNTLFWDGDKLTGDNTDAAGFLSDLAAHGVELQNKTALILGDGGSAKAIKYALEQSGMASVETWTRKSGEDLIPKDLTVNCTPGLDSELIARVKFQPGQVFYDLVYVPEETLLMQKARLDGALAFNGKGMLRAQAALSFERWKQSDATD